MTGDDNDNVLTTDGGNDVIDGGAGDDTLNAGSGDDHLIGGEVMILSYLVALEIQLLMVEKALIHSRWIYQIGHRL